MKIGLLQFPGSNCDQDCIDAFRRHYSMDLQTIWHTETTLPSVKGIIIPGGFSYGDYLRSGALASHSPVMQEVVRFAGRGGPIMGVCNGFQVLTETKLLPGALLKNASQKFICKTVALFGESGSSAWHKSLKGSVTRLPIAHGQGRYHCDEETLAKLTDRNQIVVRYSSIDGKFSDTSNPNGSMHAIAGIVNDSGKIFGLMPHPERATDVLTGGSSDGLRYWKSFIDLCS